MELIKNIFIAIMLLSAFIAILPGSIYAAAVISLTRERNVKIGVGYSDFLVPYCISNGLIYLLVKQYEKDTQDQDLIEQFKILRFIYAYPLLIFIFSFLILLATG